MLERMFGRVVVYSWDHEIPAHSTAGEATVKRTAPLVLGRVAAFGDDNLDRVDIVDGDQFYISVHTGTMPSDPVPRLRCGESAAERFRDLSVRRGQQRGQLGRGKIS